jgi:endonuclease YncB( thermonuclease family)
MKCFKIKNPLVFKIFVFTLLFLISAIALASDFTNVEYIKNHDGDTFTVNIKNLPDVFGKEIPVRIRGVDTPEMTADRECEKTAAENSRLFLKRTLTGTRIKLLGCERDKYFRLLCTVKAGSVDVGERILKGGWGVPYDGGTKSPYFCGNPEKQN